MTAKKSAPAKAAPAAAASKAVKAGKAEAEDKKKAVAAKPAAAKPAAAVAEAKGKPGRKPKAGAAAAKKEEPEEDFSDLESDLEGEAEPEAEAEADAGSDEKAAKVKPLRMKVSRAKERALMREFGLDETALTEEEVAKRRHELKTLIKMGKTRGFLTHQEINDHLPEKLVDADILESCRCSTTWASPCTSRRPTPPRC